VPDATQNLREIISGFNSMAAQVGLLPMGGGGAGGFGGPATQAFQPPQTKSPAQVAEEMAAQMHAQVQTAAQQSSVQQQFAADFTQRLQQIQQAYLPPQIAQYMATTQGGGAQTLGLPGPGGIPSPVYQTPAQMAMYRPGLPANQLYAPGAMMQPQAGPAGFNAPMPAPFIPQPYMPLWPGGPYLGNMLPQAFGGQAPLGRFGEPWLRETMQQETMGNRAFAQAMAVTPTALGTAPGGLIGAGIGARLGARGGIRGAVVGGLLGLVGGGVAGGLAAEPLGLTRAGEALVEPAVRQRAFGQQLEEMTRQFVVTGPELHPLGRGLSQRASVQLAGRFQRMTENAEMSEFNMRDVMRITNIAGQRGMLDMAQSGEQIATQVRNVARGLRQFMMIAEMPDVQQAMQSMASMRQMGMTVPETMVAARNAQTFARMAGMTTQGIMNFSGAQGGFTFQQAGMTAGLGMQAHMGALGVARQSVAAGAFTPQQLALAGGTQGLAQTMTEGQAAMLNLRYPLMGMLTRGENGQLTIDTERMRAVQEGRVSLAQQAAGAAANISRLAQQGGVSQERVISEFTTRQRELSDELGRRLGPMGRQMMFIQQGMQMQHEFGGHIGLGAALRQMGMSQQQARDLELMAGNRETWRAAAQQLRSEIPRMRQEEMARREHVVDAGAAATRRWAFRPAYEAGEDLGRVRGGLGEMYRGWREDVASWWTGGDRTATGAEVVRPSRRLAIEDRATRRAFEREMMTDEGFQRARGQAAGIRPTRGDVPLTAWEEISGVYGGMKDVLPWAIPGGSIAKTAAMGVGTALLPEATAARQSNVSQWARARGGDVGRVAEFAPWAVNMFAAGGRGNRWWMGGGISTAGALTEELRGGETYAEQLRREAEDVTKLGGIIGRGAAMGGREMQRAEQAQIKAFETARRGRGGGEGGAVNADTMEGIVQRMNQTIRTRERAGRFQGLGRVLPFLGKATNLGETEAKQHFIAAAKGEGIDEATAAKQWDQGAREVVMGRLSREGGAETKAALTSTQEAFTGGQARNLREAQEQAEKQAETTRTFLGETGAATGTGAAVGFLAMGPLGAGIGAMIGRATRISEKGVKGFEEFALKTEDDNLLLLASAQALEDKGDGESADSIRDAVRARLAGKPGEFARLSREAREPKNRPGDAEIQQALRQYGKTMAGLGGEQQLAATQKLRAGVKGVRQALVMHRGAAALAAEEDSTPEAVMEKAQRDQTYRRRLISRGLEETGAEGIGGKGAGGTAERDARAQAEKLEAFGEHAARAAGLTSKDLRRFHDATDKLDSSADYLHRAAQALVMKSR
jgi:hypothetical protein